MIENKIAEMLGQLADKLGVASAKIWEWSLLQVKVEVVTDIITILVAILASVVFVWITKKSVKWWRSLGEKDDVNEELVAASVVAFVTFCILLLVLDVSAFLRIWDIPELLINPEYAAFQNIVEQLGSLK